MSNLKVGQLVRPNSETMYGESWTWFGNTPTPKGETEVEIHWGDTFIVEDIEDEHNINVHHLKSGLRMIPLSASSVAPIA